MGMDMEKQRVDSSSQGTEEAGIDLVELMHNFLRLFSKYWWIVFLCFIVGTGAYGGFSYIRYTPRYACSATFTVGTGDGNGVGNNFYYSSTTAQQLSKTFPYVLESGYFKSVLLEKLDAKSLNGTITASTVSNSNVVTMKVESPDGEEALRILNTALEVYPETARFVLGKLQFHMLDEAQLPTRPYNKPQLKRIVMLGGGAGAMLGFLILGLLALLRKTVKTPEQMKEISSLKCLSTIPQVKFKARKLVQQRRISMLDKRVPEDFAESMRTLQLRVEREMGKEGAKVLLITSTESGEGKSTLAVNLAEVFAARGRRVLLMDGDLRKQETARLLGCKESTGLDKFVKEGINGGTIRKIKDQGFWFIGGSSAAENPAAVLSHPNVGHLIDSLKKNMDYIILDSPPCGNFQDASILQEYADAVLYVVKYDYVPGQKILEGFSLLREGKQQFLGYAFNGCPQNMGQYGYGRYGYGRYGYGHYGRYGYGGYGAKKRKDEEEEEKDEL